MRVFFIFGAVAAMAACGGGAVTGDISEACETAGRRAASPELCSCVQQVANQTLTGGDQARAAAFFSDPQLAQSTRQSDNSRDEAFWQRYKSFTEVAGQICQPINA